MKQNILDLLYELVSNAGDIRGRDGTYLDTKISEVIEQVKQLPDAVTIREQNAARRERKRLQEEQQRQLQRSALNKLTDAERKSLGL